MSERHGWVTILLMVILVTAGVQADIKTGLVGHWPFDGDLRDISGSGNDGTLSGGATFAPDQFGTPDAALFFPGEADAYVDMGDQPEFHITGELTLAVWVFLNSTNVNNGRIIAKGGGSGSRSWNLNIEASSGGVANPATFQVSATGAVTLSLVDSQPLPTDRWVHMAGVYRPGEATELYVDGELHASNTTDVPTSQFSDNGLPLLIGSRSGCSNCGWDGFIDDVRIYARALTAGDIREAMRGDSNLSSNPEPADGAGDVPRDTTLSWEAGISAATHDVYFGTSFVDVNEAGRTATLDVLASEGQTTLTYDPAGVLDFGRTYYWRVDEVNAAPDYTVFKGSVWSFTTEPLAYPVPHVTATASGAVAGSEPEKTVDGSGLDTDDQHSIAAGDMWLTAASDEPVWIQYAFDRLYRLHEMLVWNYNVQFEPILGFGLRDVTIEYSADGENWSTFAEVEFAQATARGDYRANTTVALDGIAAKYIRVAVNSGWGLAGQFGLSEVRFLYTPVYAREPEPADGAGGVGPETVLNWRSGREAATHEVYLGTDAEALEPIDAVAEASLPIDDLLYGRTYYWRVDEVNEAAATALWPGRLWSFATEDFALLDGFEAYNDDDNLIYEAWIDGWVNETGSTVGYLEAPFAERTVVHTGRQSMPLGYENAGTPFYSEAQYDLGAMDLTEHGADALRLYVYGQADNDPGTLYVALEDTAGQVAVATNADEAVLTNEAWQEWVIPFDSLGGFDATAVRMVYIGVGDRDDPTAGGAGTIFIDDVGYGHPAAE